MKRIREIIEDLSIIGGMLIAVILGFIIFLLTISRKTNKTK